MPGVLQPFKNKFDIGEFMSLNFNIIDVLEKQIVNMQPMIQSQDNKISFF
ncbi:Uncharacterised protein [Actinobacillus equuli]|nr:Uncharacterised protein [Actinobacillus equuli]